jgi:hypothetical protein
MTYKNVVIESDFISICSFFIFHFYIDIRITSFRFFHLFTEHGLLNTEVVAEHRMTLKLKFIV